MGNVTERSLSLRQDIKKNGENLKQLAEKHDQLVGAMDQLLTQHQNRLSALEETCLALVETVGMEEVQAAVNARKKAIAEERIKQETEALQAGVTRGYVVPREVVTEDTYLVGVEHDKEGNLLGYGPQQCSFSQLPDEFKTLLLGKKVGDVVTTPKEGKFELTGVYFLDMAKRQELAKAEAVLTPVTTE